ncbi:unnamed protein product [Protopolystoma xenopodis]|uniref:Asparaginase n=1 Tax=Protopolystoma xenopodis TaxID=117903 RepID=A0A448W9Y8_9PLAT|nr:unnamed protein product [Protopolystoma xenopodis]
MAGAVAALPDIKQASQVAREVFLSTRHTLLVGPAARDFAISRGFQPTQLETNHSETEWHRWHDVKHCQPNFRRRGFWTPDPGVNCGPYTTTEDKVPGRSGSGYPGATERPSGTVDEEHHDTIGMIAIDHNGRMAVGTSTNGAAFHVPGRVGDTPIVGAGGFVDGDVGAAVGTGDGDVMMRFLLSFKTVELMRSGIPPTLACQMSLATVRQNGTWHGGLVALRKDGLFGGACVGFKNFNISFRSKWTGNMTRIIDICCSDKRK